MEEEEKNNAQEVTIEVVPETVTEIVYLKEESDEEKEVKYEIGSVDTSKFPNSNLVLDENSEMVVLFPAYEPGDDVKIKEEIEFNCSLCNYQADSFDDLQIHLSTHKPQCHVCGEFFTQKNALSRHLSEAHSEYNCNICKEIFIGRRNYIAHTRQHQNDTFCQKCDIRFNSAGALMEHLKTHGPVMLYACNKCDEAFPDTSSISAHLRIAHPPLKKYKICK